MALSVEINALESNVPFEAICDDHVSHAFIALTVVASTLYLLLLIANTISTHCRVVHLVTPSYTTLTSLGPISLHHRSLQVPDPVWSI